ncbi:MAG: FHA domain-containing protein [Verrucomicrobia bacterium]|nr:FHA domain-containing protein [Verrucomicrobiota bacterium]
MKLRYTDVDGVLKEIPLEETTLTIGRSSDADVVIRDEKASRIHCGIRFEDGAFFVKDLKSKNGIYVNGQRIESARLSPGDQIRVCSITFIVEASGPKGTETLMHEVQEEMQEGKGYTTMLKEIVDDTGKNKK